MRKTYSKIFLGLTLAFVGSNKVSQPVYSQVLPSAASQNDVTVVQDQLSQDKYVIRGGARRGRNLFHRFSVFSPNQKKVDFVNPRGVRNIFGLVNGRSKTRINNTVSVVQPDLETIGGANLYLINPLGFNIDQSAAAQSFRLNGDLVISSADFLDFGEQGRLNTRNNSSIPLLTIDPSGLGFRRNSGGQIRLASAINARRDRNVALVGSSIQLLGGEVLTRGGRILIGSYRGNGVVDLDLDSSTSILPRFPRAQLGDINLTDNSRLRAVTDQNSSDFTGNAIEIFGRNITLEKSSSVTTFTGRENSRLDIKVHSGGRLSLNGDGVSIGTSRPNSPDQIQAGNINIYSNFLSIIGNVTPIIPMPGVSEVVQEITAIGPSTEMEPATNGNIRIYSTQGIEIDTLAFIGTEGSVDIDIPAGDLVLANGSIIGPTNFGVGSDFGEDINISVSGVINLSGQADIIPGIISIPSAIVSNEDIRLDANVLNLTDGAFILTSSSTDTPSGDIEINTSLKTSLSGTDTLISASNEVGSGDSGDIVLSSPIVEVTDEATVSVGLFSSTLGPSLLILEDRMLQGGTLNINAQRLSLDSGEISANTGNSQTARSNIANIFLNISDSLTLRNNSRISATTDSPTNGGNILILNTPLIRASDAVNGLNREGLSGNDIVAAAPEGRGGNILISSRGEPINISELPSGDADNNGRNDINASGAQPGTVDIDPVADFTQGLIELPSTVVDPDALIANNPCSSGGDSEFTLSGYGGLPQGSSQVIDGLQTQVQPILPQNDTTTSHPDTFTDYVRKVEPQSPQPMQGWKFNHQGKIQLVASQSQQIPKSYRQQKSATCQR